jgi:hypothetical protein
VLHASCPRIGVAVKTRALLPQRKGASAPGPAATTAKALTLTTIHLDLPADC